MQPDFVRTNILFFVCSHRGDIRREQKNNKKTTTYNYYLYQFPHRTMSMVNGFDNINDNLSNDNFVRRTGTNHPSAFILSFRISDQWGPKAGWSGGWVLLRRLPGVRQLPCPHCWYCAGHRGSTPRVCPRPHGGLVGCHPHGCGSWGCHLRGRWGGSYGCGTGCGHVSVHGGSVPCDPGPHGKWLRWVLVLLLSLSVVKCSNVACRVHVLFFPWYTVITHFDWYGKKKRKKVSQCNGQVLSWRTSWLVECLAALKT